MPPWVKPRGGPPPRGAFLLFQERKGRRYLAKMASGEHAPICEGWEQERYYGGAFLGPSGRKTCRGQAKARGTASVRGVEKVFPVPFFGLFGVAKWMI